MSWRRFTPVGRRRGTSRRCSATGSRRRCSRSRAMASSTGNASLFDYGCGRGDDVRGLVENGLDAAGWDPYYAPDNPIQSAAHRQPRLRDQCHRGLRRAPGGPDPGLVPGGDPAGGLGDARQPERCRRAALPRRGHDPARDLPEVLHPGGDQGLPGVGPGRGADPGGARGALCAFGTRTRSSASWWTATAAGASRLREPSLRAPARERVERAPRERRDRAAERYDAYREPLGSPLGAVARARSAAGSVRGGRTCWR